MKRFITTLLLFTLFSQFVFSQFVFSQENKKFNLLLLDQYKDSISIDTTLKWYYTKNKINQKVELIEIKSKNINFIHIVNDSLKYKYFLNLKINDTLFERVEEGILIGSNFNIEFSEGKSEKIFPGSSFDLNRFHFCTGPYTYLFISGSVKNKPYPNQKPELNINYFQNGFNTITFTQNINKDIFNYLKKNIQDKKRLKFFKRNFSPIIEYLGNIDNDQYLDFIIRLGEFNFMFLSYNNDLNSNHIYHLESTFESINYNTF